MSRFERLVSLQVLDDSMYQSYRENMIPILEEYGGFFRCDFRIAEVLKPSEIPELNRVFVISFLDKESMEKFFSDDRYLKVKKDYFLNSVGRVEEISRYLVSDSES